MQRMRHDEYENIVSRPRKAAKRCDDIPSPSVTRMCNEGLVIWPGIDGEDGAEPDLEAKEEPEQEFRLAGDEHATDDNHAVAVEDEASEAVAWLDAALGEQLEDRVADDASVDAHQSDEREPEGRSEPLWTVLPSSGGDEEAAVESLL